MVDASFADLECRQAVLTHTLYLEARNAVSETYRAVGGGGVGWDASGHGPWTKESSDFVVVVALQSHCS